MARLGSIGQYMHRPSSPSAGRLPSDPYYKLRLQAELNDLERLVRQSFVAPEGPSPIASYANTWAARSRTGMLKAEPTAPNSPSLPVAPEGPTVDSIVVSEQEESEAWLRVVAPTAAIELKLARKRLDEAADLGGYEQCAVLAHALESVRRAMNKLADSVFPPQPGEVPDRLGKNAPTDERAYKARISLALQGATDAKGQHRLANRELALHHQRLSQLVERIAKGVHGEGDFGESRQLYVGCWQIVAVCRLHLPIESFSRPES